MKEVRLALVGRMPKAPEPPCVEAAGVDAPN